MHAPGNLISQLCTLLSTLILSNMVCVAQLCKRTVISTKAVEPGKFHSLSALDRLMESHRVSVVYYYRSSGKEEFGDMTRKLRESFSETLSYFPMVTGRLVKDDKGNWMIRCNDAGVRMIEAKAQGSVQEWLSHVTRENENKLLYWEDMSNKPYYWSTFYLQITEFEAGGIAVGLSCIHLLADPTCVSMFIKAWADITLGQKMTEPPFFHALPSRRERNKMPKHQTDRALLPHYKSYKGSRPTGDARYTTVSLFFPNDMVEECMRRAKGSDARTMPSPFEALTSLFWVCLSKVKGKGHGLIDMSICFDVRKALSLDKGLFGNCMVGNKVMVPALNDGEGENKLPQAARAISEAVDTLHRKEEIMDLIEWLECSETETPCPFSTNGGDLVCVSLEGVNTYSSAFEDCMAPIRVSCYIEPLMGEGQIVLFEAPKEDGPLSRMAMITIGEDEMVKFMTDDLLSQFSPTIWMDTLL